MYKKMDYYVIIRVVFLGVIYEKNINKNEYIKRRR